MEVTRGGGKPTLGGGGTELDAELEAFAYFGLGGFGADDLPGVEARELGAVLACRTDLGVAVRGGLGGTDLGVAVRGGLGGMDTPRSRLPEAGFCICGMAFP